MTGGQISKSMMLPPHRAPKERVSFAVWEATEYLAPHNLHHSIARTLSKSQQPDRGIIQYVPNKCGSVDLPGGGISRRKVT